MRILLTAVVAIVLLATMSFAAEEPADTSAADDPKVEQAEGESQSPPQTTNEEKLVAPAGGIKEAAKRSLQVFVPSEEIDVDRPVDFPTNI